MPKAKKRKARSAVLLTRLRKHLRSDPAKLPILEHELPLYERANLHLAIEELFNDRLVRDDVTGVVPHADYDSVRLSRLCQPATARNYDPGPVEHLDAPLADGRQLACVRRGMFFLRDGDDPLILLLTQDRFSRENLLVEVMGADRAAAERFLDRLVRQTRHGRAFRGHVLSVEQDCYGQFNVQFHHLPPVQRDEIILPAELLRRIERHTLSFTRHAEKLRQAGRHLKRGILLYGPPGVGKTLSAMYLAAQMPGRTVLLLTGGGIASLEAACRLARLLTPATIILEDVDLIGTERQYQTINANGLLLELLNQMDGLADDIDLLFILTTNRPDILEPALAARPGRIDQAIEVPPPDADCRRRLFELYGRGLTSEAVDWNGLVERTEGMSGAFIRELLRKAAVFAAEEAGDGELIVRQPHVEEALMELLVAGGPLTQGLLGFAPAKR
jgi:hypothetical protein